MNPILLAPTTLPDTPPLEYIAAAAIAGYAGMALRVHASPGLPFHPLLGNPPLIRDIRHALDDAPPKAFGAGAKWRWRLTDPQTRVVLQNAEGEDFEAQPGHEARHVGLRGIHNG